MPLKIKKIKRELKKGLSKVGKDSDGQFKTVPPQFIARDTNKYPKLKVLTKEIIPKPNLSAVTFRSDVLSEKGDNTYRVSIRFAKMSFKNAQSPAFPMTGKFNGEDVFFNIPSIKKHSVNIRCSCPDSVHRFSWQMMRNKALNGVPVRYERKTPAWPIGYPKVNASDKIGYCKHVHSLLANLMDSNQLKEV